MTMSDISEIIASNYLLVTFTSGMGRRTKKDRRASEETTANYGARKGSAKVVKDLYHGASEEIDAIASAIAKARNLHYSMTVPFSPTGEKGARLLHNEDLLRTDGYAGCMARAKAAVDKALDALEAVYDIRVQQAMAHLQGLAMQDDYPTFAEFKAACHVGFVMEPVPTADGWGNSTLLVHERVGSKLIEHTKRNMEKQVNRAVTNALERVVEPLQRMLNATTMTGAGKYPRLFDSIVGNMEEVARLLHNFNLYNDPQIAQLQRAIETKLLRYSPDQLRANEGLKEELNGAAKEVSALLEAMDWAA
jgi:hypothetical protein